MSSIAQASFQARRVLTFPRQDVDVDTSPRLATEVRPAVVELEKVSKVFSTGGKTGVIAVTDLSLTLPTNTATLITGPSGSGKTTLLSLIGCMVRPSAGRIRVSGREVTRLTEEQLAGLRRRHFGFVFQNHHLIHGASALDNVMLPALPCPEVNGSLRQDAKALLDRFRLLDRYQVRVERLSGGEQQRVAIARALINNPLVFIADEPTAHLDTDTAQAFIEVVYQLQAEGKTIIVASHDPVLCRSSFFSQVLEMRDGRLRRGSRKWC